MTRGKLAPILWLSSGLVFLVCFLGAFEESCGRASGWDELVVPALSVAAVLFGLAVVTILKRPNLLTVLGGFLLGGLIAFGIFVLRVLVWVGECSN